LRSLPLSPAVALLGGLARLPPITAKQNAPAAAEEEAQRHEGEEDQHAAAALETGGVERLRLDKAARNTEQAARDHAISLFGILKLDMHVDGGPMPLMQQPLRLPGDTSAL